MFRKWEISMMLGLLLTVLLGAFGTFEADCQAVRADTLRLHIRANSDSVADQNLKIQVRDIMLQQFGDLFAQAQTKQQAKAIAKKNIAQIQQTVQQAVNEKGYDYTVQAQVQNMYFSTTPYEEFTLPAGYYDAVRIDIGTAQGKNWFCVMYPALCLPGAQTQDALAEYTTQEQNVVQSKGKLKFAVVEWWQSLQHKNN